MLWDRDAGENLQYLVYQLEEGEEKTPHVQGYLEFKKSRDKGLKWLKANVSARAHYEKAIGTGEQNKKYCTKEPRLAGPLEWGEIGVAGRRTDLRAFVEAAKETTSWLEMVEDYPSEMIRYPRFFDRLRMEMDKRGVRDRFARKREAKDKPVKIFVWWGEAGAGKTKSVYEKEGAENIYVFEHMTGSSRWFDGYKGEHVLLLDEFAGYLTKSGLLQLTDPYPKKPLQVQTKGGYTNVFFESIYLCSNTSWDHWYDWGYREAAAFKRRIFEEREFHVPVTRDPILDLSSTDIIDMAEEFSQDAQDWDPLGEILDHV